MSFDASFEDDLPHAQKDILYQTGSPDGFCMTIREPTTLTFGVMVMMNIVIIPISLIGGLTFGASPFALAGLIFAVCTSTGPQSLVIPALIATAILFVLSSIFIFYGPTFMGPNLLAWHIARRVNRHVPQLWDDEHYTVQIALEPRYSKGIRAILDDCDDIGVLFLSADELCFEGDSISMVVPRTEIRSILDGEDSAVYGLFGLGKRTTFLLKPGQPHPIRSITICERRSAQLLQYHRYARVLVARLKSWLGPGGARTSAT